MIRYRPHIDGLRGLAVIAVLLYHLKLLGISGGFVGVDIFFVISGFIIASVVFHDIETGTFSLFGFWERRIRRIVPALFMVMLFCIVAAYFLLLFPPDYQAFLNATIAQSAFVSNLYFMQADSYFDQLSLYSPILHTWSLSVEEQFYIIFPLLVALCAWVSDRISWSRKKALFSSVAVIGLSSLFLNVWFVNGHATSSSFTPVVGGNIFGAITYTNAAFYLLPARAWELALGVIVAVARLRIRSVIPAEMLAMAGISAIASAFFLFDDSTSFPGIAALLPTLGAAMIIIANESVTTVVGALLSSRALVWTGLISYGLYLWHWPLTIFAKLFMQHGLNIADKIAIIGLAVLISYASYKFVEMPIRKKIYLSSQRTVYFLGFGAMLILVLLSYNLREAATDRSTTDMRKISNALVLGLPDTAECYRQFEVSGHMQATPCEIGSHDLHKKPQFVLWGDSHALALAPVFESLGKKFGIKGLLLGAQSCSPIESEHSSHPRSGCVELNASILKYIQDHDVPYVILAARWDFYVETDAHNILAKEEMQTNLLAVAHELTQRGSVVYIVRQVPEQPNFDLRDPYYRTQFSRKGISLIEHAALQKIPNEVLSSASTIKGVHFIDPASILCDKAGYCAIENDAQLLYDDGDHLSIAGALTLVPAFSPIFALMPIR